MHHFRHALAVAALAVLPLGMIVAETAKTATTTTRKKSTATTARKKTGQGGAAATSTTRRSSTAKRRTTSTKTGAAATYRAPSRARQLQPTPDRYREIQQALASKGYLKSEPSGTWDQESMDAMRRFQQDQNINASGKIDSLTLIALGLGPKRPTGTPAPPPPLAPAEPPAAN